MNLSSFSWLKRWWFSIFSSSYRVETIIIKPSWPSLDLLWANISFSLSPYYLHPSIWRQSFWALSRFNRLVPPQFSSPWITIRALFFPRPFYVMTPFLFCFTWPTLPQFPVVDSQSLSALPLLVSFSFQVLGQFFGCHILSVFRPLVSLFPFYLYNFKHSIT